MALTTEQEKALLALLDQRKVTLAELPVAAEIVADDLFFTRQDVTERSVTPVIMKNYFSPAASVDSAGIVKLNSSIYSESETEAATPKAVNRAVSSALQKNANLSDLASVEDAIFNLGLKERLLPTGIPLPWPGIAAPAGYLKCNGAAFDKNRYPELALVYTSGILPDLRGEFIRGWDDGRGVDAGRGLNSWQDSDNKKHEHNDRYSYGGNAGGEIGTASGFAKKYCTAADNYKIRPPTGWLQGMSGGLSSEPEGGIESRPRNIAFNYILRAA